MMIMFLGIDFAKGEFRRLSMREFRLSVVLVASKFTEIASTWACQRLRSLGRAGGKGTGVGLGAS